MNWGKGIFLTFVVFIAIMTTMVVISMKQNVNLVADDYYKKEINYQQEIEMIRNYMSLEDKPEIHLDRTRNIIVVSFPGVYANKIKDGKVHFFRPSDNRLDKVFKIDLTDEKQLFDAEPFKKGMWRAKVLWSHSDKDYYNEFILTI